MTERLLIVMLTKLPCLIYRGSYLRAHALINLLNKLLHRGSCMGALVLLNLLNELRKRDKM